MLILNALMEREEEEEEEGIIIRQSLADGYVMAYS